VKIQRWARDALRRAYSDVLGQKTWSETLKKQTFAASSDETVGDFAEARRVLQSLSDNVVYNRQEELANTVSTYETEFPMENRNFFRDQVARMLRMTKGTNPVEARLNARRVTKSYGRSAESVEC